MLSRAPLGPVEAIGRLAGLQAQEPKPPFLGLWSRLEGFRREDLVAALGQRSVVRATLMRATLHLLGAEDYAALRPALASTLERTARNGLKGRDEGLDHALVLPAARELLHERPRGFTELRGLLGEQVPGVNERALGYTVRTHLPLVMVPVAAAPWGFPSVADFALAEDWLGRGQPASAEPDALVLRYLAAFGPASPADAQTWSGMQGLAAVFERLRSQLAVFRSEAGRELFDLPDAPRPDPDAPAPARLLPEFDNLVLAHADRARLVADEHRPALVTKNLRVRATFLWDGMVAGTWEVTRTRGVATLAAAPFRPLPARAAKELEAEAEALLRFAEDGAKGYAVTGFR